MRISFEKRLRFYRQGQAAAKRFSVFPPYTPGSKECWWWRGFYGMKAPVNPLVYMTGAKVQLMPGTGQV